MTRHSSAKKNIEPHNSTGLLIYVLLSTAAWISRYYHTHLQSFELRNVVDYRTGFIT
jgi:hypothetical protein